MWSLPRSLVPEGLRVRAHTPGAPGSPPLGPALPSLFISSCSVCFFLFVSLVFVFLLLSSKKICTFTLQIVNSKNCILNFYMREEEPTSIYIYINISLYIYIQIYIKQMLCHLVAFLWLEASFLSSPWEADGMKPPQFPCTARRCQAVPGAPGARCHRCHRPCPKAAEEGVHVPVFKLRAVASCLNPAEPGLSFPGHFHS